MEEERLDRDGRAADVGPARSTDGKMEFFNTTIWLQATLVLVAVIKMRCH